MNALKKITIRAVPDEDPDTSYLEQEGFEDALASYNRGDFGFVGVYAEAEVRRENVKGGYSSMHRIRTPGIWGIETDSEDSYFREVGEDELDELKEILTSFNVDLSNWDTLVSQALDNI